MKEGYCCHIMDLNLQRLKSLLKEKECLPLACSECYSHKCRTSKSNEISEIVYICLFCLNVGCTSESNGHARKHYKSHPNHILATKPNGEIYCYYCETDVIPYSEEEKDHISELQGMLRKFFEKTALMLSNQKEDQLEMEEIKDLESGKETDSETEYDKKNEILYHKLIAKAQKYPTMRGLHNLGNTCKHS